MADISATFPTSADHGFLSRSAALSGALSSVAGYFRRRRIYQQTLRQLEGYSERNLEDMGVTDAGVEAFARRAAGF
jgi:uncharacterized protein YjiS (DUF1127 family)